MTMTHRIALLNGSLTSGRMDDILGTIPGGAVIREPIALAPQAPPVELVVIQQEDIAMVQADGPGVGYLVLDPNDPNPDETITRALDIHRKSRDTTMPQLAFGYKREDLIVAGGCNTRAATNNWVTDQIRHAMPRSVIHAHPPMDTGYVDIPEQFESSEAEIDNNRVLPRKLVEYAVNAGDRQAVAQILRTRKHDTLTVGQRLRAYFGDVLPNHPLVNILAQSSDTLWQAAINDGISPTDMDKHISNCIAVMDQGDKIGVKTAALMVHMCLICGLNHKKSFSMIQDWLMSGHVPLNLLDRFCGDVDTADRLIIAANILDLIDTHRRSGFQHLHWPTIGKPDLDREQKLKYLMHAGVQVAACALGRPSDTTITCASK